MLLQVVADAWDVRGDLDSTGEPTRATLRSAEFGFFGRGRVDACAHAATLGATLSAGVLVFSTLSSRPLRTSCWIVGISSCHSRRGYRTDSASPTSFACSPNPRVGRVALNRRPACLLGLGWRAHRPLRSGSGFPVTAGGLKGSACHRAGGKSPAEDDGPKPTKCRLPVMGGRFETGDRTRLPLGESLFFLRLPSSVTAVPSRSGVGPRTRPADTAGSDGRSPPDSSHPAACRPLRHRPVAVVRGRRRPLRPAVNQAVADPAPGRLHAPAPAPAQTTALLAAGLGMTETWSRGDGRATTVQGWLRTASTASRPSLSRSSPEWVRLVSSGCRVPARRLRRA